MQDKFATHSNDSVASMRAGHSKMSITGGHIVNPSMSKFVIEILSASLYNDIIYLNFIKLVVERGIFF